MLNWQRPEPDASEANVAANELRAFVERIEAIEADVKERNADKSDIYAEAKGRGFDVKAIKKIVAERRIDPGDRAEMEAILELYRKALGE